MRTAGRSVTPAPVPHSGGPRLKRVGVELPTMRGATVETTLHIRYAGTLLYKGALRPCRLPVHAPLLPEQEELLRTFGRRQGQRCRQLVLGTFDRFPYRFFSVRLPDGGLALPQGTLAGLRLEVWVQLYDPLPYPAIFHLRGSTPRVHPFGPRTLWVEQPQWLLATALAPTELVHEETPCGCGARTRLTFGG